jgi:hypothetical protein
MSHDVDYFDDVRMLKSFEPSARHRQACSGRILLVCERSLSWTCLESQVVACSENVRSFYDVAAAPPQTAR